MYRIATGSFTNAVSSTDVMMLLVRCTLQDLLIKVKGLKGENEFLILVMRLAHTE